MLSNDTRELPAPINLFTVMYRDGESFRESAHKSGKPEYIRERPDEMEHQTYTLAAYCIKSLYSQLHRMSDLERCWATRHFEDMKAVVCELLPHIPSHLLCNSNESNSTQSTKENVLAEYRRTIHPQLWALLNVLVTPSTLPPLLRHLSLPLSDPLLPSLQMAAVLSTATLSLLTSLSLDATESRLKITDEAMIQIRTLKCLTVLNLAATPVTSRGIRLLMPRKLHREPSTMYPDRLRVLDLRRTFVDDELLHSERHGQDVTAFPFLCALDLRGTSVSLRAVSKFRESWKHDSNEWQNLFHPTPPHSIMSNLSQLLHREYAAGNAADPKCEHAFLFIEKLDHPPSPVAPITSKSENAHKLRVNTSGVAVVTATDVMVGNVYENEGSKEEGSASARFKINTSSSSSNWFENRPRKAPMVSLMDRSPAADADRESDRAFALYRTPPIVELKPLHIKAPAPSTSGEPVTKRKRGANDAYSIKRFRGSAMRQIFGAAGSLSSRRL